MWPEDIAKTYPAVAGKFRNLGDFAKSYSEMEKYQGGSVRLPGENATPEQWAEFYNKVGRPEAADKYDIKFPDGTTVNDDLLSSFRGTAHQLGLSQRQAAGLAEWFAGQSGGLAESNAAAAKADQAKWESELKQEWGYTYDRNVNLAGRGFAAAVEGNPEHPLAKLMDSTGLGNHPTMIRFFHDLALKLGEDKFVDADQRPSETDVQTAREELGKIMGDIKNPYWKGDPTMVERVKRLHETIAAAEG